MFKRLFSKRERQLRDQRIQELEKSAQEEILTEQIKQEEYVSFTSSYNTRLPMIACSGVVPFLNYASHTNACGEMLEPSLKDIVGQAEYLRERRKRLNAAHISCPGGLSG